MKRPRLVLAGFSPSLQGLKWETDTALRIGRHQSADIVLNDNSVGRLHAEVALARSGWVVRDLAHNERHQTLVNGRFIGQTECRLDANDVMHCGNLALQVEELETPPPELSAADTEHRRGSTIKTTGSFVRVEAASRRTWDEALVAASQSGHHSPGRQQNLLALLRTGQHLSQIGSLDELLESVLADAVKTLGAQRGAILLAHRDSPDLRLRTVLAPRLSAQQQRCYSKTMAERSFKQGESLLCSDVAAEAALSAATSVQMGTMTSLICAVLRTPRKRLGILHLDRGPTQMPFDENDFFLADAVAASLSIGIECAQLIEEQREQFAQTVASLARAVDVRDFYTGNHTRRVADYALLLADELKLAGPERYQIQIGTPLHDIGKIGIDDAVLRKPDRLTPAEYEHMKLHTVKGAEILASINALSPMIPIVRHHHERWDGTGYPDGLAAENIHQTARIVAVADAFDAMTSDRPYRSALPVDYAFQELALKAGSHFDPACVIAFMRLRPYVENIMKQG
jgi:HD-GYP domain-containing protein (c-di-GMP phosphodiesterase class II)